jgi:putative FmdB family regulatory protein
MPVYEYECNKCSKRFEVKRSFSESGGNICPHCGSEGRQIYFPTPLHFKGSGFYVTDNRKKGDYPAEEGQSTKPESGKPATRPEAGKTATKSESGKPAVKPDSGKPMPKTETGKKEAN